VLKAPAAVGLRAADPESSNTTCHGPQLVVLRTAWLCLIVGGLIPAISSFVTLLSRPSLQTLSYAGVFTLDPRIVASLQQLGLGDEFIFRSDLVFRLVGISVFSLMAIAIFLRKSDDWMTALTSFMLVAAGTTWFAPLAVLGDGSLAAAAANLVSGEGPVGLEVGASLAGLTAVLFLYLFPDGRFFPRWTRFAALAIAVHFVLWRSLEGSALDPTTWGPLLQAALVVAVVGSCLNAQIYRYAVVSTPVQRQQTKLVVAAFVTLALVPPLLFLVNPGLGAGLEELALVTPRVQALYKLILLLILGVALLLIPVSIGISVLRYRLWDIDLLINRTVVYGVLTGILGLTYFVIVAFVSAIARQSYVTAAVATLGVAILFQPLRQRLQNLIDRHFFRQRYDATKKIEAFALRLREAIDLDTLAGELLTVIRDTMLPSGVSLWVSPGSERSTRAAATDMSRIEFWVPEGREIRGPDFDRISLDEETTRILLDAHGPIDVDSSSAPTSALRRFAEVHIRLCVPLTVQGDLVGVLNLGPRLSETDYSSEDRKLLDDLSGHAAAAVRVALLVREKQADMSERERIHNELRVAQLIQRQLVPKDLPRPRGWKIFASYRPAREVGGDFYDFITLADGQLLIVVGDVTGKGIPAALMMASTRSIIRGEALRLVDPSRILESTNEQLLLDIPRNMFVTCLCALLDPRTGRLTYANAGHSLPYLRSANGVKEVWATGTPLGLLPEIRYESREIAIGGGETILFHSDGLAEAHNQSREMFSLARMQDVIADCSDPERLIDALLNALGSFTGEEWEQEDDITLVVVHSDSRQADAAPRGVLDGARRRVAAGESLVKPR
jgi:serine phosphatase RsbU (regulator of sigma subunit)